MHKSTRKSKVENTNKEVTVKNSEEEEIKIPKCSEKFTLKMLMRKCRKSVMNMKILGYVSVGEEVKLI